MDGNNYFIFWSFLLWSIHWLHFIEVSTLKYLNPKFTILSNEKFYKETNAEKQAEIRKNMLRLVKKNSR